MKIALFANTDWYLYNFRRTLALAAVAAGYEVLLVSPPGPNGERLRALGLRWAPVPAKVNLVVRLSSADVVLACAHMCT